jgi:arylsulfatase A-like enzyme
LKELIALTDAAEHQIVISNPLAAQLRRALLLVAVVSSLAGCGKPARPDHLVIVLFDTLRADRMSLYGFERETTPFLEQLADESVLFESFKAVAPWTLPTHATLFTGLRPAQHGAQWGRIKLPDEYVTLAERLKDEGFCTAGLSANPLVRRNNGLVQGFDEYEIVTGPWPQRTEKILASFEGFLDDLLTRECRILFFLNLMDTHIPYNSGKNAALFGAEGPGPVKNAAVKWAISSGTRDFSEEEKAAHRAAYEAAVRTIDDAARSIVEILLARELLDRSLLVFTSDHGDGLGSHTEVGHSISTWEEQLAIPLLIRFPHGAQAGRRVEESRSQVGFSPSILDWLEVSRPEPVRAVPNLLVQRNPDPVIADYRSYFSESNRGTNLKMKEKYPELAQRIQHQHVLFCPPFKLIAFSNGLFSFYNIEADPDEQQDLRSSDPPELRPCVQRYRQLEKDGFYTPFSVTFSEQPEEEVLESLRALGYVQ